MVGAVFIFEDQLYFSSDVCYNSHKADRGQPVKYYQ